MKNPKIGLAIAAIAISAIMLTTANSNQQMKTDQTMMNSCDNMNPDMQEFAKKLNKSNRKMFCEKFDFLLKADAIEMASELGNNGKPLMTPDQAVQKVAEDMNLN